MMRTPLQDISYRLKSGDKLYLLIGINIVIFLVTLLVPAVGAYLRLPSYLPALGRYFWTPVTYMFVHDGFISVIFNMLWLYWMGRLFEEYLGNKRILGLYLLGGLAGAAVFILSYNLIPALSHGNIFILNTISGATASVMAIIVATATLLPNSTIILLIWPVKLKWLVVIYIAIDLLNIWGIGAGVVIAHAGGALFGFLYIQQLQKGSDWIAGISNLFKSRSKLKVAAKNPAKKDSYRPRQEDVDRILDKISQKGYDHLNKEEKEILFRASKNES
jgi:membrane associated rhomboid family serine protease